MPPRVALIIGFIFVAWVLRVVERSRQAPVSKDIFWPTIWFLVAATREVGVWLQTWGVPLPGSSGGDSEGSIVDRYSFLFMGVMGLRILMRRNLDWKAIFGKNRALVLLFAFMLASVVWSDYPFVSFKRYIKCLSAFIMVLVVLTEANPYEAMLAIIRRCAYVTLPLTIVVIKYFRSIGVEYDWTGTGMMWKGLATSKNTMGQSVLCSALCFVLEMLRNRKKKVKYKKITYLYFAMSLYLLKGSDKSFSLTSLTVFFLGLSVFTMSYLFRERLARISRILVVFSLLVFVLVIMLVVHTISPFAESSTFGVIIKGVGRDITLSGRTGIWSDVLHVASRDPLLGVGYGGFWIGRAANIPWDANLSWVLGEAHDGYIDTYLQIGLVGIILLLGVVVSSWGKILQTFATNFEYGRFRLAFLLIILFVNITESTFLRGEHLLWFVFLFVVTSIPVAEAPPPSFARVVGSGRSVIEPQP
jgi:O-antigen ligase